MNMKSDRSVKCHTALFVITGIISCFIAVGMLIKSVPVKAVVTSRVETVMTGLDNRETAAYEVYASYTYNGEEYNDIYCGTFEVSTVNRSNRSVGSVFSLRIDPDDLSHAKDPQSIYLLMALGAFLGVIGFLQIIFSRKENML